MSNRQQSDRGHSGPPHDSSSPYKRAPPQTSPNAVLRPGPPFYQDPRFGMAVAAAGPYASMYSSQFQQPSHVDHSQDVREQFTRDRLQVGTSAARDAELYPYHRQRRPQLLESHHPGVDRSRQEPPLSAYGQHYHQESMGNLQPAPTSALQGGVGTGPQPPKRPRIAAERPDLTKPLTIDVTQAETKREPAYNPQVEAISPTLPPEETQKVQKVKDELLQNISRIDKDINLVEQQIAMKQKKRQQQEEAASKQNEEVESDEAPETTIDTKNQSIAQIIYAENRRKAAEAHNILSKMGPKVDVPLYNQPKDTPIYHENKRKFALFKPRLIAHFKKRHQARKQWEKRLSETYNRLMQAWQKKVEKWENSPKHKAKEAKFQEIFEKVFPELKKARDEKDRLSRQALKKALANSVDPDEMPHDAATGNRAGGTQLFARSEAEFEQIVDGITEQEEEDRKMRTLAVVPPMMLDARQRRLKFINKNGLISDCMEEYKERKYFNVWTAQEKQIFKEKYLQHPKNFGLIASFLEKKSTQDCVEYYYRSKKSENYKQMLKRQSTKKKRQQQKPMLQQTKEERSVDVMPSTSGEVSTTQPTSASMDESANV
ncbi:hypothetical protein DPMN_015959, partial [Dreissena polymorpha]